MLQNNFFLCGTIGWCLEIFWTGFHKLMQKDFRLMGQSSIWMFPIYGLAACIGPISHKIMRFPRLLRGIIYTAGIFAAEYSAGSLLKRLKICPWDYSQTPLNYKGLIRLDYAPLWFLTGLMYEKILEDRT